MRDFIYTDQGHGAVQIVPIEPSQSYAYLPKAAMLRRRDQPPMVLPAGTIIHYDGRLDRQTQRKPAAERRTHQILEEGVHHAARQCLHVKRFECADGAEMEKRVPQLERISKSLYECGQLEFSFHEEIVRDLASCREGSFGDRKTSPTKGEVRTHLDTANRQRSKVGRLKAMPASAAARASKRDVLKRLRETLSIHAAFDRNYLALDQAQEEMKDGMDFSWTQLGPNGAFNPSLARAMHHASRDRTTIRIGQQNLVYVIQALSNVRMLPYLPLAAAATAEAKQAHWGVDQCRRKQVDASLETLRYLLRRMRMLWHLEQSVIFVLSFPPDDGAHNERAIRIFRERLEKTADRVADLKDPEFDPGLREVVKETLSASQAFVKEGEYDRAREELKDLTKELRVQPVTVGRKAA